MAVMAVFDVLGPTEDLLERYEKAMPRIIEVAPGTPLTHICVPVEGGIRVVDVWESEELLQAFAGDPRFREAIHEAGLPDPQVQVFPVHRLGW
jgi:hypothetical protein